MNGPVSGDESSITRMKAVAAAHPKKTAGVCATLALVLGIVAEGRPLCAFLPPQGAAICMAITAGAAVGTQLATQLDDKPGPVQLAPEPGAKPTCSADVQCQTGYPGVEKDGTICACP